MNVRINRFTVRHNGQEYGAGKVISGLSAEEGKKLVAESNGDIEEIVIPGETTPSVDGGEQNPDGTELPPVDPSNTVKTK